MSTSLHVFVTIGEMVNACLMGGEGTGPQTYISVLATSLPHSSGCCSFTLSPSWQQKGFRWVFYISGCRPESVRKGEGNRNLSKWACQKRDPSGRNLLQHQCCTGMKEIPGAELLKRHGGTSPYIDPRWFLMELNVIFTDSVCQCLTQVILYIIVKVTKNDSS